MDKQYHQTLKELESMGVTHDYWTGWAGGYLGNPAREEQRVNKAYEAGYADGKNHSTDSATDFLA